MVFLDDKKVSFLQSWITLYFESINDNDKIEMASMIIGTLDYILSVEDDSNE